MIIICKQELDGKVNSVIKSNHIIELKTDPTQEMQRTAQNVLKLKHNKPSKKIYNQDESTGTQIKSKD
jgi:cell shape-determining protein MreC